MSFSPRRLFMSKLTKNRGVAFGMLLFLSITSALSAQTTAAAAKLRDVLSGETLVYVDAPDFQSTIKRGTGIPFVKILQEEEFQEFLSPIWKMVRGQVDQALVKIGEKPENWQTCPLRNFEVAFGSLAGSADHFLFVRIDCGQVNGVLRKLIQNPEFKNQFELSEAEGAQIVTVKNEGMVFALQGDQLIAVAGPPMNQATPAETVEMLLKSLKGSAAKGSLTTDPEFTNLLGKMQSKQPEWTAFARPAAMASYILSMSGETLPTVAASRPSRGGRNAMAQQVLGLLSVVMKEMKLNEMRGLMFSESYIGGSVTTETAILIPPSAAPVAAFLGGGKPVDRAFLDKAIDGVDGFTVYNIEPKHVYKALVDSLNKFFPEVKPGEPHRDNPIQFLTAYEKKNNISIEGDLISLLGPEYYSYSFPPKSGGGGVPTWDSFYVVRIREKAKIEKTIHTFIESLKAFEGEITIEMSDATPSRPAVYTVKLSENASQGNPAIGAIANQVQLSMALLDDWMMISTNTVALKNELRNIKKPRESSAEVKKMLSALPADASSLSYNDWRPMVRSIWDALASVAALAGGGSQQIPVDLQKIPTSQSIIKHLVVSTGYWTLTKDGVYGRSSGSFGLELYGTGLAGFGAAGAYMQRSRMMAPDMGEDEPPPPAKAKANPEGPSTDSPEKLQMSKARDMLLRLETGVKVYKSENSKLPADLAVLLKANDDHPKGYLPGLSEIPKDPWGSAYHYEIAADGKSYQLRSFGPNTKDDSGGGDDLKAEF